MRKNKYPISSSNCLQCLLLSSQNNYYPDQNLSRTNGDIKKTMKSMKIIKIATIRTGIIKIY